MTIELALAIYAVGVVGFLFLSGYADEDLATAVPLCFFWPALLCLALLALIVEAPHRLGAWIRSKRHG